MNRGRDQTAGWFETPDNRFSDTGLTKAGLDGDFEHTGDPLVIFHVNLCQERR